MSTLPWWKRLSGRLLEEDAALRALTILKTYKWTRTESGEPRIMATLDLAGESLELEIRFPVDYPEACPSVRPIPYGKSLSTHQFGGDGVLCLELGPDNWHPRYHASDMLESAWTLLAKEFIRTFKPIEIPSRHVPRLAEQARFARAVFLRPEGFDASLAALSDAEDMECSMFFPDTKFYVWPASLPKGTPVKGLPFALRKESPVAARFRRLRDGAPYPAPKDPTAFLAFLQEFASESMADEPLFLAFLLWPDGRSQCCLRLGESLWHAVDIAIDPSSSRTPEALQTGLRGRKVGIVGLGSLGAKIAESLARSGLRRFLLVDQDIVLAPNLCRHTTTYRDVGAAKVEAVKRRIEGVCLEEPDVACRVMALADATNPEVHDALLNDLADVDLLIDATANPDAFCVLAMLASDHELPLVWGEVFAGGLGGFVASADPTHTPCPRCVRLGLLAELSTYPEAPRRAGAEPYAGAQDEPLVATDSDVAFVAAMMTKRALDTLVGGDSYGPPVTLLGLRAGWIFARAFDSRCIDVRNDDWSCPRCWAPAEIADPAAEAAAELLFSRDANDPPHD